MDIAPSRYCVACLEVGQTLASMPGLGLGAPLSKRHSEHVHRDALLTASLAVPQAPTSSAKSFGEGQKGTPGRTGQKCHDRASPSRPLVLSLGPLTSLTSFPSFL